LSVTTLADDFSADVLETESMEHFLPSGRGPFQDALLYRRIDFAAFSTCLKNLFVVSLFGMRGHISIVGHEIAGSTRSPISGSSSQRAALEYPSRELHLRGAHARRRPPLGAQQKSRRRVCSTAA
jgi:hypothetical protein